MAYGKENVTAAHPIDKPEFIFFFQALHWNVIRVGDKGQERRVQRSGHLSDTLWF